MLMRKLRNPLVSSFQNFLKMKIISLFVKGSFSPLFKCGADPVTAAAILAGGSLVGSTLNHTLGYAEQRHSQDINLDAQISENQKNRDWQTAEAEKARQFNTSERVASQDWQKSMMDYQNAYNAPVMQAARLRAAGLNPQVAMSSTPPQQISAGSGSSHPASSPMPAQVSGLSPVGLQPASLQIPEIVSSIGSLIKSTAEAKKLGLDTSYYEELYPLMLKFKTNDLSLQEFAKQSQELSVMLKRFSFNADLTRAFKSAEKEIYEALNAKLMGQKITNEAELLDAQKDVQKELSKLTSTQARLFGLDIATYFQRTNSLIALQSAQAESARASAQESRANTAVLNEEQKLRGLAARFKSSTFYAEFNAAISDLHNKKAISDKQFEEVQQELKRVEKIKQAYSGHEDLIKADAALEHLFKLLGINLGVSVHN